MQTCENAAKHRSYQVQVAIIRLDLMVYPRFIILAPISLLLALTACSKSEFAPLSSKQSAKEKGKTESSDAADGDGDGDANDDGDLDKDGTIGDAGDKDDGGKDDADDLDSDADESDAGLDTDEDTITARRCASAAADAVWFQKGIEHANGCWYLGYTAQSCTTVCGDHGGVDERYVSYSGSGGSDLHCLALANAFEAKVPVATNRLYFSDSLFNAEAGDLGCGVTPRNLASEYDPAYGQMVFRVTGTATSPGATRQGFARFCSCKK